MGEKNRISHRSTNIAGDHDDYMMQAESISDEDKLKELQRRINQRADSPDSPGWKGALVGAAKAAPGTAIAGGAAGGYLGGLLQYGLGNGRVGAAALKGAGIGAGAGALLGGLVGGASGYGKAKDRQAEVDYARRTRETGDYGGLYNHVKAKNELRQKEERELREEMAQQREADRRALPYNAALGGLGMITSALAGGLGKTASAASPDSTEDALRSLAMTANAQKFTQAKREWRNGATGALAGGALGAGLGAATAGAVGGARSLKAMLFGAGMGGLTGAAVGGVQGARAGKRAQNDKILAAVNFNLLRKSGPQHVGGLITEGDAADQAKTAALVGAVRTAVLAHPEMFNLVRAPLGA